MSMFVCFLDKGLLEFVLRVLLFFLTYPLYARIVAHSVHNGSQLMQAKLPVAVEMDNPYCLPKKITGTVRG